MTGMRNLLLCTTAAVSLATAASAADIPVRKAPPKPTPVVVPAAPSWTGCYVGGHAGWGWGRKDFSNIEVDLLADLPVVTAVLGPDADFRVNTDGFLGGVQAGCDYQYHPNWVLGLEGTFSWANINGDFSRTPFDPFLTGKTGTLNAHVKTESVTTLVGHLGLAQANWMLYGLVGIAWARDKYSVDGSFINDFEGLTFEASGKETRTGYVVGAGGRILLGGNLFGFVEYNFMDFGDRTVTLTGTFTGPAFIGSGPFSMTADIDQRVHVLKAGLNWRFGGFGKAPAPVVAKY